MAFETPRLWCALGIALGLSADQSGVVALAQRSGGAVLASVPPASITRIAKYATGVNNLEKTVAFYRDALGINLRTGTTLGAPAGLNAQLLSFANVPPGTQFRSAFLTIPGALGNFEYELTEFTGLPRPSSVPRIQDPGASVLILGVADLDGVVAKVMRAGGGLPSGFVVAGAFDGGGEARGALVQDPDGAFVALVQPAWAAGLTQAIGGARFGFVVADAEKAASFYRDRLGLQRWTPDPDLPPLGVLANNLGSTQVASVIVREGTAPIDFFSFPAAERTRFLRGMQDPGVPVVGLEVKDAAATVAAIKAGWGTIVSGGGKGVPGMDAVFTRDPSGILIEVIQTR